MSRARKLQLLIGAAWLPVPLWLWYWFWATLNDAKTSYEIGQATGPCLIAGVVSTAWLFTTFVDIKM